MALALRLAPQAETLNADNLLQFHRHADDDRRWDLSTENNLGRASSALIVLLQAYPRNA